MVSSLLVDALGDPTKAVADLYTPDTAKDFAAEVTKHFSDVFRSDAAFHQIPLVDVNHAPECFKDRSLVRFRAMVQDTSGNQEMFLSKLPDGKPGGWGMESPSEDGSLNPIDYSDLRECQVIWAVDIPGESEWCARELDGEVDHAQSSGVSNLSHRPHKSPVKGRHVGLQVKIYDTTLTESLRSTDCITFIGILTHEATTQDTDVDSTVEVPTLHVLFTRPVSPGLVSRPYPAASVDESLRHELISWIAEEALGGDQDTAEWILLAAISRVQSRHPPLYPPSLTLSNFPPPPSVPSSTTSAPDQESASETPRSSSRVNLQPNPAISHVLSILLPLTSTIPLTTDYINTATFAPISQDEDLHAGLLQLSAGTVVVLSEAGLAEGAVNSKGLGNVRACQEAMGNQTLNYEFPYSVFTFPTDLTFVNLVSGKTSAFFKTDITVSLQLEDGVDLYKPAKEVKMPPEAKLAAFRDLVLGARTARISVNESTSEYIQRDFVTERQQSKISTDELILRMTMAKLLAQSLHAPEVTIDHWERTKKLEASRKARLVV